MPQQEIGESTVLLDEKGQLVKRGWARAPLFLYDRALIRSPQRRILESDRYLAFSDRFALLFEVFDGGYLGEISVTVANFSEKSSETDSFRVPFSFGSLALPESSVTGSIKIRQKHINLDFAAMDKGSRLIKFDIPALGHRRGLRGALVFTPPEEAESIVTVAQWRRDKRAFRYSRRSPWYAVEGMVRFGAKDLLFTKNHGWGVFDWQRGVRPHSDFRYWATACGLDGDRTVAFSVGYGAVDSSLATDNAFFVDGKVQKLNQVTFHITPKDWLEPWRFTGDEGRFDMTFEPLIERSEHKGLLFYSIKRRQVFGRFSGQFRSENGELIKMIAIPGFAERIKTRW